jgi:hypothetical protein
MGAATVLVDGKGTPFEVCAVGDGYWAGAGRVPAAIIIIDSADRRGQP